MTQIAHPRTLETLESASLKQPLIGYSLHWRLGGIRVPQEKLHTILKAHGLESFLPDFPRPRKTLRRAILSWLSTRSHGVGKTIGFDSEGEDDEEEENRANRGMERETHLVRCTNEKDWLCFGIVQEAVADFGFTYGTTLRVFYQKKNGTIFVSSGVTGKPSPLAADLKQDSNLTEELRPHWDDYRSLHLAGDLSGMMCSIVKAMNAVQLTDYRGLYGLYFAPVEKEREVLRAKSLMKSLPTTSTQSAYLCALGILDENSQKEAIAPSVHHGLMKEVSDLKNDLGRFVSTPPGSVRPLTIGKRLAEYRRIKEKVEMYADLIDFRREEILAEIETLRVQAEEIVLGSPTSEGSLPGFERLTLGFGDSHENVASCARIGNGYSQFV